MNIMVFDVPAVAGGALSILNEFYCEVKKSNDENINWIFVVSKPNISPYKNIKVLRFPWIKKSWIHRLVFDYFIAPKLIKKYNIDKILSLQNVVVPYTSVSQILYLHQPLPFVNYRYTFKENKLFWIYQNLIDKSIMKSVKIADKVIVQTEWLKKSCIEKTGKDEEKIKVIPPKINYRIKSFFYNNDSTMTTFFYPASSIGYKNHKVIVEACKILKNEIKGEFRVIFTLSGNEDKDISKLYQMVKKYQLPIQFIGSIEREKVFDLYTKSILIFPSYIETFGLPMLEAKLHTGVIIASDCDFSHEILDTYENAYFFNPFNESELADLMKRILSKEIIYKKVKQFKDNTINSVKSKMIDEILDL